MNMSITPVFMSDDNLSLAKPDVSFQYAMLRTPFHKRFDSNKENLSFYFYVQHLSERLRQNPKAVPLDLDQTFLIIKLLLHFPKIIDQVVFSHHPSLLPIYLEKLSEQCEKISINQDELLSKAVVVVLQNGLQLLTS